MAPRPPPPPARGRHAATALLFCISLFQYVDRWSVAAVLNELQAPPAADGSLDGGFGLSDTSAGLVSTVFVFTYMILSPVFGWAGDRRPRIPLIFLGSALYAASVFAGSYARYYYQFLIFRSLVGVGEASFSVLAPTLIADWYPAGPERTSALGFYCVSLPLGAATGFVYAGEVSRLLGWRYAFRISPILSFALSSILLLTVAEPDRGVSDGGAVALSASPPTSRAGSGPASAAGSGAGSGADSPAPAPASMPAPMPRNSWSGDVRAICSSRSYVYSTIGAVGMTFTSGALAQWAPAFLQRVNCTATDEDCAASVTRTFGLITMVTGIVGTMSGAQLARWYSRKNDAADSIVCAVGLLFATPCVYTAIYLAPQFPGYPTWSAVFLGEMLVSMVWAPNSAILLSVVAPERRSTANSISLLTTHLFGDSMSPILIGVVADWFHSSSTLDMTRGAALQHALYLSVISTIVASFFFFASGSHLALDRARAEATGYRRVDVEDHGEERKKERDSDMRQAERRNPAPQFVLDNDEDDAFRPQSPNACEQVVLAHNSSLSGAMRSS